MYRFNQKAVESDNPHYDPDALLDTLMRMLHARTDKMLAERLFVQPSQICKIRKRRVGFRRRCSSACIRKRVSPRVSCVRSWATIANTPAQAQSTLHFHNCNS